jgi:hypothetical protein
MPAQGPTPLRPDETPSTYARRPDQAGRASGGQAEGVVEAEHHASGVGSVELLLARGGAHQRPVTPDSDGTGTKKFMLQDTAA